jgi:hypothetical protein
MSDLSRIPKYRCHKPSGQAVVTLDGYDHYLGRWDNPESHADLDRLRLSRRLHWLSGAICSPP